RSFRHQHPPARSLNCLFAGGQQPTPYTPAARVRIDRDPIQVEDAFRQIPRTITGKAKNLTALARHDEHITASLRADGAVLLPDLAHTFDLFLIKNPGAG